MGEDHSAGSSKPSPPPSAGPGVVASLALFFQVLSVVVGVVVSVLSFNATRQKEADARATEIARPFLELRQATYIKTLRVAAILANASVHTKEEIAEARKTFEDLYVAEISIVEPHEVAQTMVDLAREVDPALLTLNPAQQAAFNLAHALRDTFVATYDGKPRPR